MSLQIERPCIPSIFNWSLVEDNKNMIIHKKSGAVYGQVLHHSTGKIRCMHATLLMQILFNTFIRIPCRLYLLQKGDYLEAGRVLGEKEWRLLLQKYSKHKINKIPDINRLVFKHTLIQLIKNIVKIVTYPIAMIGLFFAGLYGLINPWDGRHAFASIENLWSRDVMAYPGINSDQKRMFRNSEYLGICMQTEEVWEQHNIVQMLPYRTHCPETIRCLIRNLTVLLRDERDFWNGEGLQVDDLLKQIMFLKRSVRSISLQDSEEFNKKNDGQIVLNHNQYQAAVALALQNLCDYLKELQNRRMAHAVNLNNDNLNSINNTYSKCTEAWNNIRSQWLKALESNGNGTLFKKFATSLKSFPSPP